jgi:hypothetical protein
MTSFGTRTRAVAAVLIFILSPLLSHYASSFAASYPLTALAAFIWLSVAYAKLLEGNDKKKGTNLAREWPRRFEAKVAAAAHLLGKRA